MVSYPGKWPPRRMDDQLLACGLAAVMLQTIFSPYGEKATQNLA